MKLSLFGFNMLTTLPLGQLYHDPGSGLRLMFLRVLCGSRDCSSKILFLAVVVAMQLTLSKHYWFPGEPFNPHLHLIFTTSLGMSWNGLASFCHHIAKARRSLINSRG